MDFEMENFEMIEPGVAQKSPVRTAISNAEAQPKSLILNEIHKENEELQAKLKLNYRRLLLFETENSKLIEEKNKFFFEMQNFSEKNQMLTEKNNELEKENQEFDGRVQLLNEKVYTLEKINFSQLSEIKRFAKFHLKIQNVVKPYIVQLKGQLGALKQELTRSQKLSQAMHEAHTELQKKHDELIAQREVEKNIFQVELNKTIGTYEEQIHSFSKEILDLQQKEDEKAKEISRLKKAIEFKNYFENELIKFKRIHEEDQQQINQLLQAKTALELQTQSQMGSFAEVKTEEGKLKIRLEETQHTLEVTRAQLAKQIDESLVLNERINRLEKLNNQLSREM